MVDAADGKGSDENADKGKDKDKDKAPPRERSVTTQHEATIRGARIPYSATAATLILRDAEDEPQASIFHVSYLRGDVEDASSRPVTFAFNGGPGSSAMWLHLGCFGPRRLRMSDAVAPLPPPYSIVNNEHSLLDLSDLVFIDPVGTGYSRAHGKAKDKEFYEIKRDATSLAEFIQAWLTRHGRWSSPKFLAGESYGTTRAAAITDELLQAGVVVNGSIMVSNAMHFGTLAFETGNDLPYVLYLPSYAAVAAHHGVVKPPNGDLEAFLEEARAYAIGDYARALFQGHRLPSEERTQVALKLAYFTGLSAVWIERADLRIEIGRFTKELLRERGHVIGRLDARYLGSDPDHVGELPMEDPSFIQPLGPYTATVNQYLGKELEYPETRRYEAISLKVNESWSWADDKRMGYPNTAEHLRRSMLMNPHLKVFFANGLYDLATPFFATEYTASHLGREEHIRANVYEATYPAGHMMYVHPPSMERLRDDLERFYRAAIPS
ncbi:MAG: hypothetical protein KC766_05110 [Myxococcales bacterium]|nr:hypothetical protein [Myxococcales bacterium]